MAFNINLISLTTEKVRDPRDTEIQGYTMKWFVIDVHLNCPYMQIIINILTQIKVRNTEGNDVTKNSSEGKNVLNFWVGFTYGGGLDFTSRLHGKSQPSNPGLARLAESPGLTTFIFPQNPESDFCVQVFILYPTHKQTELVKWKVI